jgi:hypothetical protein
MSDTAIVDNNVEVAQETPPAVVKGTYEAEDVSIVSNEEAEEYFKDNSSIVDGEKDKETDTPPETDDEEVEDEEVAESETEDESESEEEAEDEDEDEAMEEDTEEDTTVKYNFGGNTLEIDKSKVPEELSDKIQQFTSDIWTDYTKKSQANADVAKTLTTQRENVEKLMQLNGDALQTYSVGLQLRNDIQQLQQVDMNELWQSNPDQARVYSDSLAQKQAEFQNIVSLVDQQENALNEAKQVEIVRRSEEGRKLLNEKVKDFETKVAPKLVDYVMKTYGWDQATADKWDQNPDLTDMARKAMLYDQSRAKMKSASKSATTKKAKPVTAMKSKGKSSGSSDPDKMSMEQLKKHLKLS